MPALLSKRGIISSSFGKFPEVWLMQIPPAAKRLRHMARNVFFCGKFEKRKKQWRGVRWTKRRPFRPYLHFSTSLGRQRSEIQQTGSVRVTCFMIPLCNYLLSLHLTYLMHSNDLLVTLNTELHLRKRFSKSLYIYIIKFCFAFSRVPLISLL